MRSLLKNTVAFLAAASLGGAVLLSGGAAFAQGQQDQQQQDQQQQDQQPQDQQEGVQQQNGQEQGGQGEQQQGVQGQEQQKEAQPTGGGPSEQQQMQTSKQKAKFFHDWARSTKPGQAYSVYAVQGLLLIHNSLGGIVQDIQAQPVGGGPSEQQQQSAQQSLQKIKQNHQKIQDLAQKLQETGDITVRPQQFHAAASSVAEALNALQQMRFPKLSSDVKKVRQTVAKIDVNKPLAAQSRNVQRFFTYSSNAITKMSDELQKKQVGGGPAEKQKSNEQMEQNKEQNQQEQQQGQQPGEQNQQDNMNQ